MRAEKDLICRDRAGIERFVGFGSDIPKGWEIVRESTGSLVPADATMPRTIGNVDAAAERANRLALQADRQRATTLAAGESVETPTQDDQVVPIAPADAAAVEASPAPASEPAAGGSEPQPVETPPAAPAEEQPAAPGDAPTESTPAEQAADEPPAEEAPKGRRGRRG